MDSRLTVASMAISAAVLLGAGCGSVSGSFDPREWDSEMAIAGLTSGRVELRRARPPEMRPLDVAVERIEVPAAAGNLMFDRRQVEQEVSSRLESAILVFPHFGTVSGSDSSADLYLTAKITKLVWRNAERSVDNVYQGAASYEAGERIAHTWIECEIHVGFARADGATVASSAGLGVKASQSGVRVVSVPTDNGQATRTEEARAEPVGDLDIPDAIRYALDAAIALSLPKLESYEASRRAQASNR